MTQQSATGQKRSQQSVGIFPSREAAESACNVLKGSGFSNEQVSLDTQVLDPNPRSRDTKAAKSAGGGAIAGSLFGALVGLLLVFISLNPLTSDANPAAMQPWTAIIGVTLAGSAVGAAGGALIAALSGANVPKDDTGIDRTRLSNSYLVVVDGTQEEHQRAKEILRQRGSDL